VQCPRAVRSIDRSGQFSESSDESFPIPDFFLSEDQSVRKRKILAKRKMMMDGIAARMSKNFSLLFFMFYFLGHFPVVNTAMAASGVTAVELPAYGVFRDGIFQGWIVPTLHGAPPHFLVPHPDVLRSAGTFVFESTNNAEAIAIIQRPIHTNDWVGRLSIRTLRHMDEEARCRGLQPDLSKYSVLTLFVLSTRACSEPQIPENEIDTESILQEFASSNKINIENLEQPIDVLGVIEIMNTDDYVKLIDSMVAEMVPNILDGPNVLSGLGHIDTDKIRAHLDGLRDQAPLLHRLLADLLIDERNRLWAGVIAARPPSSVYLVFVGAGHTVTERSLQEELRQHGHEVVDVRLPAVTIENLVELLRSDPR